MLNKCLIAKKSNNLTGSSKKIQSEEHVTSEIYKSKESNDGCSALQFCATKCTAIVQDTIVPLEGKPYFTIIMGETNVCKQFLVKIPSSFVGYFPSSTCEAILCCREKEWVVKCTVHQSNKVIRRGWKEFVMDNKLRLGDGCVFELLNNSEMKFRVQILNGEVPVSTSIITGGNNVDDPIFID